MDNIWKPEKKDSRSDTDSKRNQDEFEAQQLLTKGYSLYSLGRFDEAIKCYNKTLEINPQYADAWIFKGFSEDKLGLRARAAISYRKFIELAPAAEYAKYIEIVRKRLGQLEGR